MEKMASCKTKIISKHSIILILFTCISSIKSQINFADSNSIKNHVNILMCCELDLQKSISISCSNVDAAANTGSEGRKSIPEKSEEPEPDSSKGDGRGVKAKRQLKTSEWTVPSHLMSNNKTATFLLDNIPPICTSGSDLRSLGTENKTNPEFLIQSNGWIGIGPNVFNMSYFNPGQYCINGISDRIIELRTCKPPCSSQEPCIYKCCPLNQVFSPFSPRACEDIPNGTIYHPNYYKSVDNPNSLLSEQETHQKAPFYSIRHPITFAKSCRDQTTLVFVNTKENAHLLPTSAFINFRMSEAGKVYFRNQYRSWITVDGRMCVDGLQNYILEETGEDTTVVQTPFKNDPTQRIMITCVLPMDEPRRVGEYYGIVSIICSIFALLTVIVYALLWEKQTIHGWTIMSYTTNVFFLFIFLGVGHLTAEYNPDISGTIGCKIIGTIGHFLFIGMFSWLTVVSLDLWLTFGSLTISSTRSKGFKRYLLYCLAGLGIPTFMVILGWSLEAKYADDENSTIKVPLYGKHACYVSEFFLWEFVYGSCAILFGINILFFILTTWKLIEYKRSTRLATKTAQNRQSYILFVKLFFIVGILWAFELISWASSGAHISIWWQIFDTLNCLQPVAIFIIFVLKYDMINSLAEKYGWMKPWLMPLLQLLDRFEGKRKLQVSKPGTTDTTGADESSAINMSKGGGSYTTKSESDDTSNM